MIFVTMRPTFLIVTLFTILIYLVAGVAQGQKDYTPQTSTKSGPVITSGRGDHSAGGWSSQLDGANSKNSLTSQTGGYPTVKTHDNPTQEPPVHPTGDPTEHPTEDPTEHPTENPTEHPTENPSEHPTEKPTAKPTEIPTEKPTPTRAPWYVAVLDIETNLPTGQEVLVAIETATQIPISEMGIAHVNNHLSVDDAGAPDGAYYPLHVGFTLKVLKKVARNAIRNGQVAHVRLAVPTPTPTSPNEDGGLTKKQKILLGCILGIGLPLLVLLIVLIVWYYSRDTDRSRWDDYTRLEMQEAALIDLEYRTLVKYGSGSPAYRRYPRTTKEVEDPLLYVGEDEVVGEHKVNGEDEVEGEKYN